MPFLVLFVDLDDRVDGCVELGTGIQEGRLDDEEVLGRLTPLLCDKFACG